MAGLTLGKPVIDGHDPFEVDSPPDWAAEFGICRKNLWEKMKTLGIPGKG